MDRLTAFIKLGHIATMNFVEEILSLAMQPVRHVRSENNVHEIRQSIRDTDYIAVCNCLTVFIEFLLHQSSTDISHILGWIGRRIFLDVTEELLVEIQHLFELSLHVTLYSHGLPGIILATSHNAGLSCGQIYRSR